MLRFVGISQISHDGHEERWIFEADLTVTEEERRVKLVAYSEKDGAGRRVTQWNVDGAYADGAPRLTATPGVPGNVKRRALAYARKPEETLR